MFMAPPWSARAEEDGSILVSYHDEPRYSLRRANGNGFWELRRAREEEVIDTDQYRHDILSGIQSGRLV